MDTAATRFVEAIEHAAGRGATILVAPELSMCSEAVERVSSYLAARPHLEMLVVCGSHHETRSDERANISTGFIPAKPPIRFEHRKFARYETDSLREAIDSTPARIRLFEDGINRVAILICRDLIHPDVPEVLRASGATVVLVPAFSPSMDIFWRAATWIAGLAQSMVVISNGPMWRTVRRQSGEASEEGDVEVCAKPSAILARPVRREEVRMAEPEVPSVCVFEPEPQLAILGLSSGNH